MNLTVNGLNLSDNANYLVEEVQYKNPPERRTFSAGISRRPGDKLTGQEWGSKTIKINGIIFGSSYSDLMSRIDTFQQTIAPQSVSITVDNGRSYTGTLKSLNIPNQFYNLSMIRYTADFYCVDPFAYAPTLTVSGNTISGTLTYSGAMTISGSVFAEPTITINPIGGLAGDSGINVLSIANTTTGENVTVSGTINYVSDLIFDYSNYQITNSGVLSDFQGIFSRWEPGLNRYEITVTSGTRSAYSWSIRYSPRYYQ